MPDRRIEVQGVMQTPDGAWRVEAICEIRYRPKGADREYWYRLVHGESMIENLPIASVREILAEAGVDMATLVEVPGRPA